MATGKIEYEILIPWTITENTWVGPTTNTTIRANSDLPKPTRLATDTIWVDPFDGDDTLNAGTSLVDAVKTLVKAETLVTAAKSTIHIEVADTATYGTEAKISETLLANLVFDGNFDNLQCAAGQTAWIALSGNFKVQMGATGAPTTKLNGLRLTMDDNIAAYLEPNGGFEPEWCRIEVPVQNLNCSESFTWQDTIFINNRALSLLPSSQILYTEAILTLTGTYNRCIFVDTQQQVTFYQVDLNMGAFSTFTYSTTHMTFIGTKAPMTIIVTGTPPVTATLTSSHSHLAFDCTTFIGGTNSFISNTPVDTATENDSTNVVTNLDPLFLDESNFDYRLMHIGRKATENPDVYFPQTSPAVGVGLSDAGAFDVTYVKNAETASTFTFPTDFGSEKVELIMDRANYQEFRDIKGRFHNTYDGIIREIKFNLDGDYWTGTDYSAALARLLRSKGLKRFYPHGTDGLFGALKATNTPADNVNIDFAANLARDMTPEFYTDWIIQAVWNGATKTGYFRIVSHDETTMVVEWLRGDNNFSGFADLTANILYLPCLLGMKDLKLVSEIYSEDEDSAIFKPWYKVATTNDANVSEFHTRLLILKQTLEVSA